MKTLHPDFHTLIFVFFECWFFDLMVYYFSLHIDYRNAYLLVSSYSLKVWKEFHWVWHQWGNTFPLCVRKKIILLCSYQICQNICSEDANCQSPSFPTAKVEKWFPNPSKLLLCQYVLYILDIYEIHKKTDTFWSRDISSVQLIKTFWTMSSFMYNFLC